MSARLEPSADSSMPKTAESSMRQRRRWPTDLRVGLTILAVFLILTILAPMIAPSPNTEELRAALQGPSAAHWFGTDQLGRDIFQRIIAGTRYDLGITVGGVVGSFLIALPFGLASGYFGGRTDSWISGCTETILTFPSIVLAIVLVTVMGGNLLGLLVALVATQTPMFVRFLRSFTLQVRAQEYIQASVALGATNTWILTRAILPDILGQSLVIVSLSASEIVLMIAALGFLGLGVQPPTPEWGSMLSQGQSYFTEDPSLMIFPGLFIMLMVLALNTTGQGLRKALDNRS